MKSSGKQQKTGKGRKKRASSNNGARPGTPTGWLAPETSKTGNQTAPKGDNTNEPHNEVDAASEVPKHIAVDQVPDASPRPDEPIETFSVDEETLRALRLPMNLDYKALCCKAMETFLHERDFDELNRIVPGGMSKLRRETPEDVYDPGDPEWQKALRDVAGRGLPIDHAEYVAANRHYFDFRFLYRLTADLLVAAGDAQIEKEVRLELLRLRLLRSIAHVDRALKKYVRQSEQDLRNILGTAALSNLDGLTQFFDRVFENAEPMLLASFWIVVYAALAASQDQNRREPGSVSDQVLGAVSLVLEAISQSKMCDARLPLEYKLLKEILTGSKSKPELTREFQNVSDETVAHVGSLAAFLSQLSNVAYGPLTTLVTEVYDRMRLEKYGVGSFFDKSNEWLFNAAIPIPDYSEHTLMARSQKPRSFFD